MNLKSFVFKNVYLAAVIVVVISSVSLLIVGYNEVFQPSISEIKKAKLQAKRIHEINSKLNLGDSLIVTIENLERMLKERESSTLGEDAHILHVLAKCAQKSGVIVQSVRVSDNSVSGGLEKLGLELEIGGGFNEVHFFLSLIENQKEVFQVSKLEISKTSWRKRGLKANLLIQVFQLNQEGSYE